MIDLEHLTSLHRFRTSVAWRLTPRGLEVDGEIGTTRGRPATVARVWRHYGKSLHASSVAFQVPVELLVATAATETQGRANAVREEPGYVSDEATPHRVSPGLMQTLISTARSALGDHTIDRRWLLEPDNSIRAGAAYIAHQAAETAFDPPMVAAAYNAGGIYYQDGRRNRWRMRQYPIGTGHHLDRFVLWFNDCFRFFAAEGLRPESSFAALLAT